MADLREVAPPRLDPLRRSFEYDQMESELKAVFMAVFERMIRPRERELNLYGMPHLGTMALIERALKDSGLALVRRNEVRASFLLKAMRGRNPHRGTLFLARYLQSVWPNVWKIEPLWHPVATANNYPADCTPLTELNLGDGVTAEFDGGAAQGLPTLFRTNWQGKQHLYPAPRTNTIRYSQDFGQAVWTKTGYGTGSAPVVTPNAGIAPDGTQTASRIVFDCGAGTADGDRSEVAQAQTTIAGESFAQGVWMRSYDGVSTYSLQLSFDNAAPLVVTVTPDWTYSEHAAEAMDAIRGFRIGARADIGSPQADVLMWGAMQIHGPVCGSYIPTDADPATVTDYTVDEQGVATFPGDEPPPTPIEYFLTGRIRVTLPVSSDNGLGLLEIAKAFRPTLAARLMLELHLSIMFENIGAAGGLALANALTGVMPYYGVGALQLPDLQKIGTRFRSGKNRVGTRLLRFEE